MNKSIRNSLKSNKKKILSKYINNKDNEEKNDVNEEKKYINFFMKLLILGDSLVGKTTLISRFVKSYISNNQENNFGKCKLSFENNTKTIIINNIICEMQIWEPSVKEYNTITKQFYRDCNGCILLYDITNKESFLNIEKIWLNEIKDNYNSDFPIIIVGNKKDLENKREVSFNELVSFCHKNYLDYSEVSSFMNSQVDEIFNLIAQKIIENNNFIEKGNKGISLDITSFYKTNYRKYNCNC